jgi:hypothetical protein
VDYLAEQINATEPLTGKALRWSFNFDLWTSRRWRNFFFMAVACEPLARTRQPPSSSQLQGATAEI